ncbi:MAG: UvrD-helicase domain-containing protein [bacterium]
MDILNSLNSKQKQAVTAIRGPVLVIAGPGSGKTRCLTHRIAYLMQKEISGKNILAVTFTNKAAEEMRQRVQELLKPLNIHYYLPDIGTFHAICVRILRQEIDKINTSDQETYKKNFVIYDSNDQISLIKKIIKDLQINPEQFKPQTVQDAISRAKDELIDYKSYQEQAREYFPETIAKIYEQYQNALIKANALDFDDLIMLTVNIFQTHSSILKKYQEKWQYVLIDEAHDTNLGQYTLAKLLSKEHKNIWLIADPDQNIYSWRGADFRNILNFEKDYPETKTILLEQNYRSTKNILEASHNIISKNSKRKEKKLITNNPDGPLINVVKANNEEEEGNFLIEEIENLIRTGEYTLKDFAVLYRANAQSRAVEEAFLKENIPYKIIGSVRFYDRKEIKDILSYLKLIINPDDSVSLQRIINLPPRRLPKYAKNPEKIFADQKTSKPLQDFKKLINGFQDESKKISLTELIKTIIQKINYEEYIKKDNEQGEKRWENVQELFTVANKYINAKPERELEKFLEEITLLSSGDEVETNKNLVNLMTMHCAKGLEFPVVFIVGCEDGIFPHSRSSLDNAQMEEERRLCYVGITRAKYRAYLTFAQQRRLWGQVMANPPSRFIMDIPEHLIEFQEYF